MNRNDPTDRFYFEPAHQTPLCNICRHSNGLSCKAFPDGIPIPVLDRKVEQKKNPELIDSSCNGVDSIHFEPLEEGR